MLIRKKKNTEKENDNNNESLDNAVIPFLLQEYVQRKKKIRKGTLSVSIHLPIY